MTDSTRSKLTVRTRTGLVEESDDAPLQLAVHDFTLPCRRFLVEHKVAEVGRVSVTAEFLLRLLKITGGIGEDEAAAFFGYDRREMAFVLSEVEQNDFVERFNGRLALTTTGHQLFGPGQDEPAIFEVEQRAVKVGLDLISLAPQERASLTSFEIRLPELPVTDAKLVAGAAEQVPTAFRRYYGELVPRNEPTITARRSLYSIDTVTPKERYSAVVRVGVVSSGLRPSQGEVDLTDWRPDYELSDREPITIAASRMLEKLTVSARADDHEAYDALVTLAPEFLKEYVRRDGLSIERYYRHCYVSRGDVRADRPTVPIIGSLFTQENARRLVDVVGYGLRKMKRPVGAMFWVAPITPMWGGTTILSELLERTLRRIDSENQNLLKRQPIRSVLLSTTRPERWTEEAFSWSCIAEGRVLPGGLELVVAPGAFAAALVHAPIGIQSGLAVPLGFASFDEHVIARATAMLHDKALRWRLDEQLIAELLPSGSENVGERTET
ncbi:hypothetical protein ASF00_17670 [Sphingomonas sp. Leaf34]|uniref:hypothetical protein n=1 Tax=Sphingomonas sp. Leaf34 TaxID=1736216 RepID=UPI0006F4FC27|nr:hypothetical protein [Sphingomonas sp. Leaf34]KQN24031.1 hypothetical protein ASF00_17670 [Sphingomonas sp. Leaf34]